MLANLTSLGVTVPSPVPKYCFISLGFFPFLTPGPSRRAMVGGQRCPWAAVQTDGGGRNGETSTDRRALGLEGDPHACLSLADVVLRWAPALPRHVVELASKGPGEPWPALLPDPPAVPP